MFTAALLSLLTLASCNRSQKKKLLPTISGKAGEVIVVTNKGEWEGTSGTCIRDLLTSDCPYLPQKEPLYTLVNVAPSAFTNIFQIHRNVIIMNISDEVTEPGIVYRQDVWATPQCVIAINAPTDEIAVTLIEENSKTILNTIEQAERDRIIINTLKYEEKTLYPIVAETFGGSPHFPSGYVLKKQTNDFIWIAYETTYVNRGFLFYKYPASGAPDELSPETLVAKRNEVLRENVPGMFENTYMTTSEISTPGVEYIKFRGHEFAEMRGLWEVYNDFMGGPFVSHTYYSQDGSEILTFEGFVYAPKYDKRHYLRQVESILYSFEWAQK